MRSLILLGVLCCIAIAASAKDITVAAAPVPLNPEDPKQTRIGSLEFAAGFALDSTAPEWGGYSGMVMAPDGSYLLAVSDVGHWLKLELTHDATGRLTGVGGARIESLLDTAGKPVAGKEWSDAEEIAMTPDGQFLVAFERHHRVWSYASADGVPYGAARPVPLPKGADALPENSGIEALAISAQGSLWLAAEGGGYTVDRGQGWEHNNGRWREFAIGRSDGFEPTAVALLNTRVFTPLLLERRYTDAEGPSARISLLSLALVHPLGEWTGPTNVYRPFTLGVLSRPLSVDNFEAIAIQQSGEMRPYIYLLSDDNQSDQQRTLLMQFRMPRIKTN